MRPEPRSSSLRYLAPTLGVASLLLVGRALWTRRRPPLEVVSHVDLGRYAGRWYEFARIPNRFERNCVGSTAFYALGDRGRIQVVNRCRVGSLEGPRECVEGTARVVDAETNARLKVSFQWPFSGDYWIIDLDQDYQWAVVGEPSRRFLWVLSRTPDLDEELYQDILSRISRKGYDVRRLQRTLQPPARSAFQDFVAPSWESPLPMSF